MVRRGMKGILTVPGMMKGWNPLCISQGIVCLLGTFGTPLFPTGLRMDFSHSLCKNGFFGTYWMLADLTLGMIRGFLSFPLLFGSSGSIVTHMFSKGHIAILRIYWLLGYPRTKEILKWLQVMESTKERIGTDQLRSMGGHWGGCCCYRWTAKELKRRLSAGLYKETVYQTEAQSLLEGLQLVWDKRYRKVKLEIHNALLIQTICNYANNGFAELRQLHFFRYVKRESNKYADLMVKMRWFSNKKLCVF